MVIKSRFNLDIPAVSLPTFIFDSPTAELPKTPAYISAKEPDKHYLSIHDYRLYALQDCGAQASSQAIASCSFPATRYSFPPW
jgi:hypothetical protein